MKKPLEQSLPPRKPGKDPSYLARSLRDTGYEAKSFRFGACSVDLLGHDRDCTSAVILIDTYASDAGDWCRHVLESKEFDWTTRELAKRVKKELERAFDAKWGKSRSQRERGAYFFGLA